MNTIIIIDEEKEICESIKMILEYEGYPVEYATSAIQGLKVIEENQIACLLLDIQMPEMSGFEVLKKVKESTPSLSVIIISAHGSVENAIKATQLGAFDFIEKPIDRDKLLISVRNAVEQVKLLTENIELKKSLGVEGEILGQSKEIKSILELIEKVAPLDTRVLITGENGTGKELVARAIDKKSQRKDKPFMEVNCAARLNPPGNPSEPVWMFSPLAEEAVAGGVLNVNGDIWPFSLQPVILELISPDGKSVGLRILTVTDIDPQLFATSIPYKVTEPMLARLTIRQDDDRMPGSFYVYSQIVLVNP